MKRHDFNFWKSIALFAIMLATGYSTDIPATTTSAPTFTSMATSAPLHAPTFTLLTPSTKGKIAFVYWNGKYDIYVMNADGSDLRNLSVDLPYSRDHVWSPDGQYIAFTSCQVLICQVYVMEAGGSDLRQLTSDEAGSYNPAWSPDGQYIIFISDRDKVLSDDGIPISEVYIMKSDGSDQKRLTHNRDFERDLSWSPDGDTIAVSVNPRAASGIYFPEEICLMDLNGIIQKQLTGFASYNSHPSWSPNGEFIAFESYGGGESNICIMKADGSDQTCLVRSTNTDSAPFYVNNLSPLWSPDGNYIVFSSNRDGDYDLYIIRTDGTDLTQLTNEPGDEASPAWSPMP